MTEASMPQSALPGSRPLSVAKGYLRAAKANWAVLTAILLLGLFIIVPLTLLLITSLRTGTPGNLGDWTFAHYAQASSSSLALRAFLNSIGVATLGTIFSAFYRANVTVPGDLSPTQAKDAAESIAGAISVARTLPNPAGTQLLESARLAFDSGIAPTATIAATLTLVAAVIVAVAFRGNKVPTGQQ